MKTLLELRTEKAELVEKMDGILNTADEEKRGLTEEETEEYRGFDETLDGLNKEIDVMLEGEARRNKIDAEKRAMEVVVNPAHSPDTAIVTQPNKPDFRNMAEFLHIIAHNPNEARVQQMKDGTKGGFAIPEQFRPELLKVDSAAAIFRPRATVIPAGNPPDAALSMVALDQGTNRRGGVTMYHQGESDTITESDMNLRKVELQPRKITGYMTSSNELLNNWDAANNVITTLLREAMVAQEDTDFLSGDGVNKSLGILNAPAAINYNRAVANQISYADVIGMFARMMMGGTFAWIASQTVIPQLANIRDTGNNNLWIQSAVVGMPNTLAGIPLIYNERSPALGSKGDLMLVDLSKYLIKDGSGPSIAVSEHFRFQNDEIAFRLTWRVDGASWLTAPVPLEEGTATNTVSPFVILDTP